LSQLVHDTFVFFLLRSKRRKHTAGVDSVIKLLSELSRSVTSSLSSSAGDIDDKNVEMSSDFFVKLNEMLSPSHTQHVQLFADVSTLNHILQVGLFLHFSLLYLTDIQCIGI